MEYHAFIGAVIDKTVVAVTAIRDPYTRHMFARWCETLIEEERVVQTFLTCAQCHAVHLAPARLRALIAWAADAEAVLTTLTQTPCPDSSPAVLGDAEEP